MEHNLGLTNINLQSTKDLKVDKGMLFIVYNKYKSFILPLAVIVICLMVLLFVVIPQMNQYFTSTSQLTQATQQLTTLKNNYNFLANLDEKKTESNFEVLQKVLPTQKDFFGIITAVSAASSQVGISIDDFKFTLGDLSKPSTPNGTIYPSIQMDLTASGNASQMNSFINQLYKTVPLVEVYGIKFKDDKADVKLQFFYKPLPPQNVSDESLVSPLSAKDQALIKNIYSWNNLPIENGVLVPDTELISSGSGSINSSSTASAQTTYSPF